MLSIRARDPIRARRLDPSQILPSSSSIRERSNPVESIRRDREENGRVGRDPSNCLNTA